MKTIKCGDMTIPCIGIGTWSWGSGDNGSDDVFGSTYSAEELKPVFDEAMKMGFNLFDTAYVYGMGSSEKILGSFIKESDEEVIASTKFTPDENTNSDDLEKSVEGSLERLNKKSLDIYWIHDACDVEKWTSEIIPYIKNHHIRYAGVSNHNLEQVKKAYEILQKENIKLSAVQNHLSLLYRESEKSGLLKWCRDNDVLFFSYMVLEQGFLTGKYNEDNLFKSGSYRSECYDIKKFRAVKPLIEEMKKTADKYDISVSAVAIQYALSKGTVPIVGVTKEKYLKDLSDAAGIQISLDDVRLLEETADLVKVDVKTEWE